MPFQTYENVDLVSLVSDNFKIQARCAFKNCNAAIIPITSTLNDTLHQVKNGPKMMIPGSETLEGRDQRVGQVQKFFLVLDVWDFDNIGVSKPSSDLAKEVLIDGIETSFNIERLLICSECDRGPIGFAGIPDSKDSNVKNLSYYLNCTSVVYDVQK